MYRQEISIKNLDELNNLEKEKSLFVTYIEFIDDDLDNIKNLDFEYIHLFKIKFIRCKNISSFFHNFNNKQFYNLSFIEFKDCSVPKKEFIPFINNLCKLTLCRNDPINFATSSCKCIITILHDRIMDKDEIIEITDATLCPVYVYYRRDGSTDFVPFKLNFRYNDI